MFMMFDPLINILLIYLIAAVLPAVLLVNYASSQPSLHKQPTGIMMHLLWEGVIAALIALVLEWLMQQAITGYKIASWELYMGVGIVEEGAKLFILKRETWDSPYFETRYDGILYAVFVSLGFAAFENIKYVYGLWSIRCCDACITGHPCPHGICSIDGHVLWTGKRCCLS